MSPWNNLLFLIPLFTGPIYIIAGIIMKKFPPKKINGLYGYRTSRSMRSKENWDFAQQYAAVEMIRWGILLTCIALPGYFIYLNFWVSFALGLFIATAFMAIPIIHTEKKLDSLDKR